MNPELLKVPPVEAIDHFRSKGLHVGFDWRDTEAEQHLVSFTAAKAMRVDVLQTLRSEVDHALADGITFREFHTNLEPRLRALGWWGRQAMADPATGETRIVQLGSPRRLQTIFDTNLRMAHARGRWQRIERLEATSPWLRYVATLDNRTRPDHRRWHGTILRWDHPFWHTHYPPCGWHCRCTVTQLSDEDLEEFGFEPSAGPPPDWLVTRPWKNARTGKIHQVPVGIDPSFEHNVGLIKPVQAARRRLGEKIGAAPEPIAAVARRRRLDDWIAEGRAERERMVEEEAGGPQGVTGDGLRGAIRRRLQEKRGAGEVAADVRSEHGGAAAARRIREAASLLPRSWVERTNRAPVVARRSGSRGAYYRATPNRPAMIRLSDNPSVALHEYVHHVQAMDPDLDRVFAQLHRRRTEGEPLAPLYDWAPRERGRRDQYVEAYTGREYPSAGGSQPLEVMTTSIEQVLHTPHDRDRLMTLLEDDPEMRDLVIGLLLHYDPA